MALIAEKADTLGARYVITFVAPDNVPSLKGCQRCGFSPDLLHRLVGFGFGLFRRDSFTKLAADDPRRTQKF
jgi:RimJ/RimL family protein N-acetyltransferase